MEEVVKPCTFCKIYEDYPEKKPGETSIFYEDRFFFARLDRFPCTPGHTEIIPIRHIASIKDLYKEKDIFFETLEDVKDQLINLDLKDYYGGFIENPVNDISKDLSKEALDKINSGWTLEDDFDFNLGVNDGTLAGRTIDHLHMHIIPRYKGDVENPEGGVRYVIPEKGNYKK